MTAILTQGVTSQIISYLVQVEQASLFLTSEKISSIFRQSGPHVASLGLTSPCAVRTRTSLRSQPNPQPLQDQPPNDRLHNDQQLSDQQHKQLPHHNKIIAGLIQTTALSAAQRPGISKQILTICNSESKKFQTRRLALGCGAWHQKHLQQSIFGKLLLPKLSSKILWIQNS